MNVCKGSFSAGHGHEACWSNPIQVTGQVECKWVGKSVQLPTGFPRNAFAVSVSALRSFQQG